MSLKTRIIIAVVLASCIINVFLSFYFTEKIKDTELESLSHRIEEACSIMQLVNARPLYNVDKEALKVNLETFFADENMKRIVLEEADIEMKLELSRDIGKSRGMDITRTFSLTFNEIELGHMTVVYSTYLIEQKIAEFRNQILWSAFSVMVALVLAIVFIVNKLMQPVSQLTRAASEIAAGNLDKEIEQNATGEVGELAKNFARMRDAVIEKINDLARSNENLANEIIQKEINEKKILWQGSIMKAINHFFQKSMQAKTYNEIGEMFIPIILDLIPSPYCFIGEVNKEDDTQLDILAISDNAVEDCRMAKIDSSIKIQGQCVRGVRELVINRNTSLIANDPSKIPDFVALPDRHIPIDTFLGVPMALGTEIKGIIALAGKKGGYEPDDQIAAEMLSVALVEALSLKKREVEKERLEEMMVQSEKMVSVGGLAAGMAHEINNPLAGILQNSQVIRNRLKDRLPGNIETAEKLGLDIDDIGRYMEDRGIFQMIDSVLDAGKRAADIVANMLSFSRKSSSEFLPETIPELMEKTLDLAESDYNLKKRFDFKQIFIHKEYQDNLPEVMCKASEIQQVFFNILSNGAQAMMSDQEGKAPAFTIRIYRARDFVVIEIRDNGPGMKENIRRRIFEPFFTTKSVGDGTGLGLAVSYFIITENHKGTIEVHSSPGRGTNFVIKLPYHKL
ncbi:MAG: HAMP domain-containing protein [Desulfobacteraceae bacterium]|nr:MAG: HAMP domain-containing protein [Desulfobacteraceae bacterium]